MTSRVYRLLQRLLAPGAEPAIARRLSGQSRGGLSLDAGCGPTSWLWPAGNAPYGVDICLDFARAFHRRSGRAVVASATALPFRTGCFDDVWSFGLLHHLSDGDARAAIREMRRVTRDGGQTVIFDAVLPRRAWTRPLAALLRKLDRGSWMRREETLQALLTTSADSWSYERITYAYTGLEGLWCRAEGVNGHR